jgi:hypothetical protein
MAKTKAKKEELTDGIEKLQSAIDSDTSASERLKEEVKNLQKALAELEESQAEMDKVRAETHAAYLTAKEDLEKGIEGVQGALEVLRNYYNSDAFMQFGDMQPAAPQKHEKSSGAGGAIINILEVAESDFTKNLEEEEEEEAAPRRTAVQEFNLAEVDPVSGGVVSSEFEEPEEDEATMVQLVGEIPEEQLAPSNFEEESMSREEIRLIRLRKKFFEMKNVKIGCCNGQAYNSQKRCCCRRVSFDMDKKFCCAINGCESFKIMNRGSIQDYNDCLSLDGLVVQEYGYQGQRGQPKIFGSGPRG